MKIISVFLTGVCFITSLVEGQVIETPEYKIFPFGNNGQLNTTYDLRQRPNCVLVNETLFLVYNDDGSGEMDNFKTKPMGVTFNLATEVFSDAVMLGPASSDHHNSPVTWVDMEDRLHAYTC